MHSDERMLNEGDNMNESAAADTQPSGGAASAVNGAQSVTKRPIKLTQKALLEKVETLQKTRKSKLNKASALKTTIQGLMQDREYEIGVHCAFNKYKTLCKDAKETHESLLKYLPPDEKEKHEIWFKAKLLSVDEFIECMNKWFLMSYDGIPKLAENVENDNGVESEVKTQ